MERIGIAGGGAIACGLAAVAARHSDVVLWTRSEDGAGRARERIEGLCEDGETARVRVVTDSGELVKATFVVEAIAEDAEAKGALLRRLGEELDESALLATTTSSLSVAELAAASGRPDRFVGLHVFNPVTKMELVELAFPPGAAEDTRARAVKLCEALGKRPVEVPDRPGFVVNRLLFPFLFDAVRLAEATGLEPQPIDDCMMLGANQPMGPFALLDFVGLDVALAIGESLELDVPARIRALVAEGALGKKSGRGFYDY